MQQSEPASPQNSAEEPLASWTEPAQAAVGSTLPLVPTISGLIGLAVLFVVLAYWQGLFGLYVAAFICLTAAILVVSARGKQAAGRAIALYETTLIIGRHGYSLASLAGFWLDATSRDDCIELNFELNRPGALPITCLFPGSPEDAREIFLQLLPELERRERTVADQLADRFHL